MTDIIIYLWLALFFVVNPLFVFFISRRRKPTFGGKVYMLATVTMFALFFFGLSAGQYVLSAIAIAYLIAAPLMLRRKASRKAELRH